jgi:thiamine-phosphate pyrophosphorylase
MKKHMKPLEACRLYAFVDTACLRGRAPETVARQLCDGGADLIQLRAKDCSVEQVREMALAILPVTRAAGIGLVINDHPALTREVGAEFCHLGQEDFFGASEAGAARRPSRDLSGITLGLSTHSAAEAERALAAEAAYLGVGPVYATTTKPGAQPVTLEYVRWAAAHVRVPWFAIGGITLANLDEVMAAGARRVCVVSAILNAPDVAAACREFQRRLRRFAL